MKNDLLAYRHIGISEKDEEKMLQKIGVKSLDELIDKTIPVNIRLKEPLALPKTMTEYEFGQHIAGLAAKNKLYTTYIGMGWYNTITPAVIQRNVFENPVWYTSYTPYQTEVSQGRLEALMNFQTAVCHLTGKPLANLWMHNGYINVDNKKMSKSLGNFFTAREVAEKYGYEVVR